MTPLPCAPLRLVSRWVKVVLTWLEKTAEIIITDDNFDSIVAGVEEGRIAYANVRKVIFLLISTGAAETSTFHTVTCYWLAFAIVGSSATLAKSGD